MTFTPEFMALVSSLTEEQKKVIEQNLRPLQDVVEAAIEWRRTMTDRVEPARTEKERIHRHQENLRRTYNLVQAVDTLTNQDSEEIKPSDVAV